MRSLSGRAPPSSPRWRWPGPRGAACIKLGVYQDNVTKTLTPLSKAVGPGLKTVSVYVTAGTGLDPKLVTLANDAKLTMLVSWMPDKGKDGAAGKKYSLSAIAKGSFDPGLRALGAQLRTLRKSAIVRPMPEPNTPWYAWSRRQGQLGGRLRVARHLVRVVLLKAARGASCSGRRTRARPRHAAKHHRVLLPGRRVRRPRRRER